MAKRRTAFVSVLLLGVSVALPAVAATAGRNKNPSPSTRLGERATAVQAGQRAPGTQPRRFGRGGAAGSYQGDAFRSGVVPPPAGDWADASAGDFRTSMPIARSYPVVTPPTKPRFLREDVLECLPR